MPSSVKLGARSRLFAGSWGADQDMLAPDVTKGSPARPPLVWNVKPWQATRPGCQVLSGDKTTDSPRSLAATTGSCLQIPATRPATRRLWPWALSRALPSGIVSCRGMWRHRGLDGESFHRPTVRHCTGTVYAPQRAMRKRGNAVKGAGYTGAVYGRGKALRPGESLGVRDSHSRVAPILSCDPLFSGIR